MRPPPILSVAELRAPGERTSDEGPLPTWIETPPGCEPVAREARPEIPPPAVDLSELASDLVDFGHALAARLVREGRREYARDIAAEVRGGRSADALAEQVLAWGEGRDAVVAASNDAWRRRGCEGCALRALASGDPEARCADCAPGGAGA